MDSGAVSFEQAALQHTGSLLRFARRLVAEPGSAEDLVQETILRAWRSFAQFEPGTNLRAWLFRILINTAHEQQRKVRGRNAALSSYIAVAETAENNHDCMEVMQALDRLPRDQRTILLLGVVEGFTSKEIAGMLNIPIGTVMSRMSRARTEMRKLLAPLSVNPHAGVAS